jgi:hypothetical protein
LNKVTQDTVEDGEEDSIRDIPISFFATALGNLNDCFRAIARKPSETRPKAFTDPE